MCECAYWLSVNPYFLLLIVPFAGQIECYNWTSGVRSSYEAMFASPTGISVFEGRIYVSDRARETISSVDFDLSSERLMQRNVEEPGVLKVYNTGLTGKRRDVFIKLIRLFVTSLG